MLTTANEEGESGRELAQLFRRDCGAKGEGSRKLRSSPQPSSEGCLVGLQERRGVPLGEQALPPDARAARPLEWDAHQVGRHLQTLAVALLGLDGYAYRGAGGGGGGGDGLQLLQTLGADEQEEVQPLASWRVGASSSSRKS